MADKLSSGVAWPPARPLDTPDLEEVPDLPPPTWGNSDAPRAFVYNDLSTREAGKVFRREWGNLAQAIEEDRVQVSFCDYPLPADGWSYPVAIAARSVQYHAGKNAFLMFVRRLLEDFMPSPYFTKRQVLDAAEAAGAPRDKIQEDTEWWRFYPIVERSRRLGEERGINNSVSRSVIVHEGERSRPILSSADRITSTADEMSEST